MRPPSKSSRILTTVIISLFALLLLAMETDRRNATFDEITVQRINVVEPDGTMRLVISNHDRFPGIYVKGEERAFDRPQAGMIFLNDEASEIGGLIFGGLRDENGKIVNSGGALSFDRYEANQVVQLIGVEDDENRFAGLSVTDAPSGNQVFRRIWLGRGRDGSSVLAMMDGKGRQRVVISVSEEGESSLSFLDEEGQVVRKLLPSS